MRMMDTDRLYEILESGTRQELEEFCAKNHLKIEDGKIKPVDKSECVDAVEYWDKKQHVTKIRLNGLYGALLNNGCRFFDQRLGQSTTLSGRQVVKHMTAEVNKLITGKYDYLGESILYNDTDSVAADSIIHTTLGSLTIEELFLTGSEFYKNGDKEYSKNPNCQVYHFDPATNHTSLGDYLYVYRHKVSKKKYRIKTTNGKSVVVTEDHSVMVLNDGRLIEKKPSELMLGDKVVTIKK